MYLRGIYFQILYLWIIRVVDNVIFSKCSFNTTKRCYIYVYNLGNILPR